jgi:glutaredoxin 3
MNKSDIASKAKHYGVRSVPAIVIDGKLASCCTGRGPDEGILRAALA